MRGVDQSLIRAAIRLSADHLLRNVGLMSENFDGDLMLGLIFTAIVQANVRQISDDPVLSAKYGPLGAIPPDDLRQPISVNALSESLAIPYETTRRYVNRLVKLGWCVKVGGRGVVVPGAVIGTPQALAAGAKQYGYLMHFLRQLKEIGFEAE
jgi:hypothetical protein